MPDEKCRFSVPKPNTCGEFVGLDTAGPQAKKKGIKNEFKLRAVLVSYLSRVSLSNEIAFTISLKRLFH